MTNGLFPPAIIIGEQNAASETTYLFAEGYSSDKPIFFVGPPTNIPIPPFQRIGAIWALANADGTGVLAWGGSKQGYGVIGAGGTQLGDPVTFQGGTGVAGIGGQSAGSGFAAANPNIEPGLGVQGLGGDGAAGYQIIWNPEQTQPEVFNAFPGGAGVVGFGGAGSGNFPTNPKPIGGSEQPADAGAGVIGLGGDPNGGEAGSGVVGFAVDDNSNGPPALPLFVGNGVAGSGPIGVFGFSGSQIGVRGVTSAAGGGGVEGFAFNPTPEGAVGVGVLGWAAAGGVGVWGQVEKGSSADAHASAIHGLVQGAPTTAPVLSGPYAGWFDGPVQINDHLIVNGNFTVVAGADISQNVKSVAVPFPDGSHRRLYCMENPECWFEDFGEAKLVKGKAQIRLPRDFATVIQTDSYHVFLTPYGNSNGLYVSKRNRQGFVVEEQGKGRSSLGFHSASSASGKGSKPSGSPRYPSLRRVNRQSFRRFPSSPIGNKKKRFRRGRIFAPLYRGICPLSLPNYRRRNERAEQRLNQIPSPETRSIREIYAPRRFADGSIARLSVRPIGGGGTMPASGPKPVRQHRCTWSCRSLTEVLEDIVRQAFGFVLGIH